MAMNKETQQGATGTESRTSGAADVGSPISNEAYNVVAALHKTLEGLEAYRKYSKDGGGAIWQRLSEQERQTVATLVDELERLVKDGKFRLGASGKSTH